LLVNNYVTVFQFLDIKVQQTKHGFWTIQLLVYLQIHHYWWHGGRQIMSSAPVHREKM